MPVICLIPCATSLYRLLKVVKGWQKHALWVFVPISVVPIFGVLVYVYFYKFSSQILGLGGPDAAPLFSPMRRCVCGKMMKAVSVKQWTKFVSGAKSGYELTFKCDKCNETVVLPSGTRVAQCLVAAMLGPMGVVCIYNGVRHGSIGNCIIGAALLAAGIWSLLILIKSIKNMLIYREIDMVTKIKALAISIREQP